MLKDLDLALELAPGDAQVAEFCKKVYKRGREQFGGDLDFGKLLTIFRVIKTRCYTEQIELRQNRRHGKNNTHLLPLRGTESFERVSALERVSVEIAETLEVFEC